VSAFVHRPESFTVGRLTLPRTGGLAVHTARAEAEIAYRYTYAVIGQLNTLATAVHFFVKAGGRRQRLRY
jgi:hypothetical protein